MFTPLHPDLLVRQVPYRAMGLWLGRQFVAIQLSTEGFWIHSPIPWAPELRTSLARIGEVHHVVGPNRLHDECLREFQREYPAATFHAAPGLARARPDITFDPTPLSDTPHPDWAGAIEQHLVRGMPRLNEVVFFHRASRSLILADLAFNLGPEGPWFTRTLLKLNDAWGRFTPSRFCKILMRDRAAVRSSIDRILEWDFDRIIVGHGHNIETGGKAIFREAFSFLR